MSDSMTGLEVVSDQLHTVGEEDFSWVEPLEDTEGFRWLPPEPPRKNFFKARGWFVDGAPGGAGGDPASRPRQHLV